MTELLAWGAMVGSWLLVAGPLHQGSTELWEMGRSARGELALTPWDRLLWLTPPILYLVQLARIRRFEAESPEPPPGTRREAFTNRATGWFAVASGGLLIALNETWGCSTRIAGPLPSSG